MLHNAIFSDPVIIKTNFLIHTQRALLIYDDGTLTGGCKTEQWASFVKIRSRVIIVKLHRIY